MSQNEKKNKQKNLPVLKQEQKETAAQIGSVSVYILCLSSRVRPPSKHAWMIYIHLIHWGLSDCITQQGIIKKKKKDNKPLGPPTCKALWQLCARLLGAAALPLFTWT